MTTVDVEQLAAGLARGDRLALARSITLVESSLAAHRDLAGSLLDAVMPLTGRSIRVGITGVPGVGKSTFIDQFGVNLIERGHRVAVLAVDPTSRRTGGSILGDKTRMERLAVDERAFVRPSPAGTTLGGVARATREAMLLCEAAGFDVVICETVGVGQSETTVSEMVDFFLVLMLAGAGDELQGIKKGVLELADAIAVNKADGDNVARARLAVADYSMAMHLVTPASVTWTPPVLSCSARNNEGLAEIWDHIEQHHQLLDESGELLRRRQEQSVGWLRSMLTDRLVDQFMSDAELAEALRAAEAEVRTFRVSPSSAVERLIGQYRGEALDC